jgi:hypothetical protein
VNVREATAHPSQQLVSAIPSQDVDLLTVAQCGRFAPIVPGDRAWSIPDSFGHKKSS